MLVQTLDFWSYKLCIPKFSTRLFTNRSELVRNLVCVSWSRSIVKAVLDPIWIQKRVSKFTLSHWLPRFGLILSLAKLIKLARALLQCRHEVTICFTMFASSIHLGVSRIQRLSSALAVNESSDESPSHSHFFLIRGIVPSIIYCLLPKISAI